MHWTDRRQSFRKVLSGNSCVYPASVYDAMSARIAEDLGFEAGMFAGSVGSLSVLGAPDLIVLTLTEFAAQSYRINRAGNLPLLVDADHGYGNALNVQRTVEELETAGVAALTIEDTVLPKPYGGGKIQLISQDEGIGKMRAALSARQDKDLVIAARTTLGAVSLEETVERARAYEKCGVDALFLAQLKDRAQLEAITAAVKLPLMLGSIPKDMSDREALAQAGVRISLQGHRPIMAAVQAVHDTLSALRDGRTADLPKAADETLMNKVTRGSRYATSMTDYLGAKK